MSDIYLGAIQFQAHGLEQSFRPAQPFKQEKYKTK